MSHPNPVGTLSIRRQRFLTSQGAVVVKMIASGSRPKLDSDRRPSRSADNAPCAVLHLGLTLEYRIRHEVTLLRV
jgi:hypothetical protein